MYCCASGLDSPMESERESRDSDKVFEELLYCSDRLSTQVFAAVEVSLMVEAMLLKVVLMELTESCT